MPHRGSISRVSRTLDDCFGTLIKYYVHVVQEKLHSDQLRSGLASCTIVGIDLQIDSDASEVESYNGNKNIFVKSFCLHTQGTPAQEELGLRVRRSLATWSIRASAS